MRTGPVFIVITEWADEMKILIVEDDGVAAAYLAKGLGESGHSADHAKDGASGYHMAQSGNYDVLIIDRLLPELDGLSMLKKIRINDDQTPALILSALGQVDDRVEGLRSGGDDYLTKPYAFSELLARVEILSRCNSANDNGEILKVADLEMDRLAHCVKRSNAKIELQPREYRLLEYLMQNAEKVVTRTMLLEKVWNYHFDPQTNVVDVHICRLRAKIDKSFDVPLLHTIRGSGFILRADDRAVISV